MPHVQEDRVELNVQLTYCMEGYGELVWKVCSSNIPDHSIEVSLCVCKQDTIGIRQFRAPFWESSL